MRIYLLHHLLMFPRSPLLCVPGAVAVDNVEVVAEVVVADYSNHFLLQHNTVAVHIVAVVADKVDRIGHFVCAAAAAVDIVAAVGAGIAVADKVGRIGHIVGVAAGDGGGDIVAVDKLDRIGHIAVAAAGAVGTVGAGIAVAAAAAAAAVYIAIAVAAEPALAEQRNASDPLRILPGLEPHTDYYDTPLPPWPQHNNHCHPQIWPRECS